MKLPKNARYFISLPTIHNPFNVSSPNSFWMGMAICLVQYVADLRHSFASLVDATESTAKLGLNL